MKCQLNPEKKVKVICDFRLNEKIPFQGFFLTGLAIYKNSTFRLDALS